MGKFHWKVATYIEFRIYRTEFWVPNHPLYIRCLLYSRCLLWYLVFAYIHGNTYHWRKSNLENHFEKMDLFQLVNDYLQNTHATTHNHYKMVLDELFVCDKKSERDQFKDHGQRSVWCLYIYEVYLNEWHVIASEWLSKNCSEKSRSSTRKMKKRCSWFYPEQNGTEWRWSPNQWWIKFVRGRKLKLSEKLPRVEKRRSSEFLNTF